MTQIHIMVLRHAAFYSPLLAAINCGFLKQQGLEATYQVSSPGNSVEAGLQSGTVHVAQSAAATSFAYLEKGETPPFVHFAQINERDGFFLASRQSQKNFHWQDLKGKSVLVDHFFQPKAMFNYALHLNDMVLADLSVIDAGDVQAIDHAFRHGEGDYVHQQGPAPQQLEKDGLGSVVASVGEAIGPVAFSSLCASPGWLETDMAHAFMQAYSQAMEYVIAAPAKQLATELQSFFPAIDLQVLESTISRYQQLGCWTPSVNISVQSYETLLDVFSYNKLISKRYDYTQVCCPAPV